MKTEFTVIPKHELEEILETLEDAYREIEWFKEDSDPVLQHLNDSIEILVERLKLKSPALDI